MNTELPIKYKLYCEEIVSRLFADMLNSANRGPNFKWSNFPDMAKRRAIVSLHLSMINYETKKIQVGEYAYQVATELIDLSNIVVENS